MIYNDIHIPEKIDKNYETVLLDVFKQEYFYPNNGYFAAKTSEYYNIFALFFKYIDKNFYQMKKYYLQGIKNKNLNSMYNLGFYYHVNNKLELSTKYFVMYIENKYDLNFDNESDEKINIIVDIFIHDKKIENYKNKLGEVNYLIYEIFSLYYKIIKNNECESKKYYLFSLEKKYNFYFDNDMINKNVSNELFLKIKNTFTNSNYVNKEYNELLTKNNFDANDIETINILVIFFKANDIYNKIIKLYEKCIELVDYNYLLKLSDILITYNKKLSQKYKTEYEIKIIETKYNINLSHKLLKFKKMFVDIFNCSDIISVCENYDLNDYNVLFVLYLYHKFITDNVDISKKYLYFSIVKKYNIFEIDIIDNEYIVNYFITNIVELTIKLFNYEHEFFNNQIEYEFNSNDLDCKDMEIVNLIGLYYEKKIMNYDEAIKYYKIGIRENNIDTMYILSSLHLELGNEKLYLKYMRMFFEYNYSIDLDDYNECQLKKIIEIFKGKNIEKKKYNLDNISNIKDKDIIEIVWLHYRYVQNNIDVSNKYYIKLLEYKYLIDFDFVTDDKYLIDCVAKIFNHEIELNCLRDDDAGNIYYIMGLYYQTKGKNNNKSLKYWKKSFEKGNFFSSKILGSVLYEKFDTLSDLQDIKLMENSLAYASEHSDIDSIIKLCSYYNLINNTDLMIKYYKKGVDLDSNICAYMLGLYYQNINEYDRMAKYYKIVSNSEDYGDLEDLKNYCKIMGSINFELYKYSKSDELEIDEETLGYLKKSSKYNYCESFYELGNYYKQKNNTARMIKYFEEAINKNNDNRAMYELGKYYKSVNKNVSKLKYFAMAFKNNNFDVLYDLGMYYKDKKEYEQMVKYFKLAVEKTQCVKSMYELGQHYHKHIDKKSMDKYYKMGLEIEPDNQDILCGYAYYYYDNDEYLKSIEFFDKLNEDEYNTHILAVIRCLLKNNDLDRLDKLLNDFDTEHNYVSWFKIIKDVTDYFKSESFNEENMIKYIVRGLNINNFNSSHNKDCETLYLKLKTATTKNLNKIYYILSNIQNPNSFIKKKINELLGEQKVCFYSNKISLFKKLNNIKECLVCYETKVHVNFECGHEICLECYTNMSGCQFRCNKSRRSGNNTQINLSDELDEEDET